MKLYLYYMNDTNPKWGQNFSFYSNYHDDEEYLLYAMTNKKKYAKTFETLRDMSMFIKRVIEIDEDDYAAKANEHRGEVLDYFSLITKDVKTHLYTIKYEDILCTMNEYQNCVEENANLIMSDDSFWQFAPNPKIFKDSIANALNTLDYNATYVLLGPESQQLFYNADDNIEITSPNGRVDELALFISLYKNTFA